MGSLSSSTPVLGDHGNTDPEVDGQDLDEPGRPEAHDQAARRPAPDAERAGERRSVGVSITHQQVQELELRAGDAAAIERLVESNVQAPTETPRRAHEVSP
jgi:hypothetical protein